MHTASLRLSVLAASLLLLAACGGGDGMAAMHGETPQTLEYTSPAPVRFSYTPYQTRSHIHVWQVDSERTEVVYRR